MLSPWLVELITQGLIFVVSCSCCGGNRKTPKPNLQKIEMERAEDDQPIIPLASFAENCEPDWDLVEAEAPETFGLQTRAEIMHY